MDTNAELQRQILDELELEPSLDAADIDVGVKEGVVTLSGIVDSNSGKLAAERAAKRIQGVTAVALELEVPIPSTPGLSDTEIAKEAVSALEWSPVVPRNRVKVRVVDGWVTLEGDVAWEFQRAAARGAVRFLDGVRGICNSIIVQPAVATKPIKHKILGAFRRSAEIDAKGVEVEAVGAKVTLSGRVHSWAERAEAERVAWSAPGVSQVVNRLIIAA